MKLSYEVQDLTKDDNEKLANAGKTIVEALAVMKEQGWVDDETAMRIAYRFAGELVDVNEMMRRMGTMDPKGAATGPGPGSVEESEGEDGSEGV